VLVSILCCLASIFRVTTTQTVQIHRLFQSSAGATDMSNTLIQSNTGSQQIEPKIMLQMTTRMLLKQRSVIRQVKLKQLIGIHTFPDFSQIPDFPMFSTLVVVLDFQVMLAACAEIRSVFPVITADKHGIVEFVCLSLCMHVSVNRISVRRKLWMYFREILE